MTRRVAALLVAGVLGLTAAPAVAAEDAPTGPEATRIMIIGDSVTHGSSGDWTFRYRLWRHLQATGARVDFVGPASSVHSWEGDPPVYADPDFDADHAAGWGMWANDGASAVTDLVTTYAPDVLVVNLGVIDIIWGAAPWMVELSLAELVRRAQAVDPEIDVVIGEVTQTWMTFEGREGPRALNLVLPALAERLTTATSTVSIADTTAGYTVADTYDSSHPAASGEVKIAAALADSLAGLGVGAPHPRPLPVVSGLPGTLTVSATPAVGSVALAWSPVPGASGYTVSHSTGGAWRTLTLTRATTAVLTGLRAGVPTRFRVRADKGTSTRAVGETVAVPAVAPVTAVRATRARTRLVVSWRAVPGARYAVTVRGPGARVQRTVARPRLVVPRLKRGRAYTVTVRAVAGEAASRPTRARFRTRS
ncbi:GDSL-type esterase/lipase family protein [Nocardioides sp. zg-DK7169]|uniref:fibronectin type III domain-containing protein n=1 Tax=Nocardioides sp. zg-DK7169 TaxID=2736600 RepID=UPI0020A6323C|nr:GDSL-type esterase/lipase family protein [Nocardioides sp. zg-DK7169]